jgi:uncharacterized protein YigA (DUF484 family)
MNPITEDDIAEFLANTPDFFERHAQLLATVQLNSPHSHRAVSLQERQAEMLRDKIKGLEGRIMDMIRNGTENMILIDKLHRLACELFETPLDERPLVATDKIAVQFAVPQVALKLWALEARFAAQPYAQNISDDVKTYADGLTAPYVGANTGVAAVQWLARPAQAASVAVVSLRRAKGQPAFGLLVLASPDSQRFHSHIGTDFLTRLADLSSAALLRLQPLTV